MTMELTITNIENMLSTITSDSYEEVNWLDNVKLMNDLWFYLDARECSEFRKYLFKRSQDDEFQRKVNRILKEVADRAGLDKAKSAWDAQFDF